MPNKGLPIFITFWFSLFFLFLAIFHNIISIEFLSFVDSILLTLLCVACSYETSRKITLYLIFDK